MLDYSSFNPGRFVDEDKLTPYSLTLDKLRGHVPAARRGGRGSGGRLRRAPHDRRSAGRPRRRASAGQPPAQHRRRPSLPDGQRLRPDDHDPQRHGRRRVLRSRCRSCPQDTNMTSLGVVKVPDGLPGPARPGRVLLPDPRSSSDSGRLTSVYPALVYPGALAQRLRRRPGHRRRHAALGLHARPDRHDAAHGRQDRRQARSSSCRVRPPSCRTATARSRSRTSPSRPGRADHHGLRRIGQAVRLAVDPPGSSWPPGSSASRCSRLVGPALGAVRAAAPHLGEGDSPQGRTLRVEYAGSPAARTRRSTAPSTQLAQRHGDALEQLRTRAANPTDGRGRGIRADVD